MSLTIKYTIYSQAWLNKHRKHYIRHGSTFSTIFSFFFFWYVRLESATEEADRLYSVSFNVPDLFLSHLNVTIERVGWFFWVEAVFMVSKYRTSCVSTPSYVVPSITKTSVRSSVNNWHEYPILIAVSV